MKSSKNDVDATRRALLNATLLSFGSALVAGGSSVHANGEIAVSSRQKASSLGFEGPERSGSYLSVDDFDMWVEVTGEGPPLLMLNGGFGMTSAIAPLAAAYARYFTVYSFDARGHGRSGFGAGPITYAREAADAVSLMDALDLKDAHIFGISDGGCASLHLLFDYPHRVRSSTLCGTPYSQSNYNDFAMQFVREFPTILAQGETDAWGAQDRLISAGMTPEKIRKLASGLHRAWTTTPNFTLDMLAVFDRPVLVVEAGADEYVELRHFEAMTKAIPGAHSIRIDEMTHNPVPHIENLVAATAEMVASI